MLRGEFQTAIAAFEEIERLERLRSLAPDAAQQLKQEYQQRIEKIRDEIVKLRVERGHLYAQDVHRVRHHLLLVEKNRVVEAYQQGLLSSAAYDNLRANIDARILELESNDAEDEQGKGHGAVANRG